MARSILSKVAPPRVVLAAVSFPMVVFAGCVDLPGSARPSGEVVVLELPAGPAVGTPGAPLFDSVARYETQIPTNGFLADVYFPNPAGPGNGNRSFPVALLLQGALVDKSNYTVFARTVAAYGFVVVVPNHGSTLGVGPFVDQRDIRDALDHVAAENVRLDSPIAGLVETASVVLIGHSFGGAAVLNTVQDICEFPFCSCCFEFPMELRAAAVYGTDLRDPLCDRPIAPINNAGVPVIVLRGSGDGIADPADVEDTYKQVQDPPKALVTIVGANHYGITDTNNPPGTVRDRSEPALDQAVATETIARWTATFLRAYALGDADAIEYVTSVGPSTDANVLVRTQQDVIHTRPATSTAMRIR